jgi:hypothetical protein
MSNTASVPPPLVLSLILCESIIQDAMTGQHSVVGTLHYVQSHGFPAMFPELCVFFELTNGRGNIPVLIRIVDGSEERPPVFETTLVLEMKHPLVVMHGAVRIGNSVFPEPGEYRIQLHAAGDRRLERRLFLQQVPPSQPPLRG